MSWRNKKTIFDSKVPSTRAYLTSISHFLQSFKMEIQTFSFMLCVLDQREFKGKILTQSCHWSVSLTKEIEYFKQKFECAKSSTYKSAKY